MELTDCGTTDVINPTTGEIIAKVPLSIKVEDNINCLVCKRGG
ncbi:hypothetical protein [Metabacillus niabensis]